MKAVRQYNEYPKQNTFGVIFNLWLSFLLCFWSFDINTKLAVTIKRWLNKNSVSFVSHFKQKSCSNNGGNEDIKRLSFLYSI